MCSILKSSKKILSIHRVNLLNIILFSFIFPFSSVTNVLWFVTTRKCHPIKYILKYSEPHSTANISSSFVEYFFFTAFVNRDANEIGRHPSEPSCFKPSWFASQTIRISLCTTKCFSSMMFATCSFSISNVNWHSFVHMNIFSYSVVEATTPCIPLAPASICVGCVSIPWRILNVTKFGGIF